MGFPSPSRRPVCSWRCGLRDGADITTGLFALGYAGYGLTAMTGVRLVQCLLAVTLTLAAAAIRHRDEVSANLR